jgi:hypothetical protein
MMQFNLDDALSGKRVITRLGIPVKIIDYSSGYAKYSIRCALPEVDGEVPILSHTKEGRFWSTGIECDEDLFMDE